MYKRQAHDEHVAHDAVGMYRADEKAGKHRAHDAEHGDKSVEHVVERNAPLKAEGFIVEQLPVCGPVSYTHLGAARARSMTAEAASHGDCRSFRQ